MVFSPSKERALQHSHQGAPGWAGYAMLGQLASGQLSTVHLARSEEGQLVALKRLHPALLPDPELRSTLTNEGRIGQKLDSPHIARVLDVQTQPEPFLALEYVEGLSLAEIIVRANGIDLVRYLMPIFVDVLTGLQTMHTLTNRRREVTPIYHQAPCARHILVGSDGVAKLVDLSHVAGPGLPWTARRDERLYAAEMAPEQVLAPAEVDARCDLFIVGLTLWEALTGQPLFADESHEATVQRMLRGAVPAPSGVAPHAPPFFDRICDRALQRAPWRRFDSAAEMADAIANEAVRHDLFAPRQELADWVGALARTTPLEIAHSRRAGVAPATARAPEEIAARAIVRSGRAGGGGGAAKPTPEGEPEPEPDPAAALGAAPPSGTHPSALWREKPQAGAPGTRDDAPPSSLLVDAARTSRQTAEPARTTQLEHAIRPSQPDAGGSRALPPSREVGRASQPGSDAGRASQPGSDVGRASQPGGDAASASQPAEEAPRTSPPWHETVRPSDPDLAQVHASDAAAHAGRASEPPPDGTRASEPPRSTDGAPVPDAGRASAPPLRMSVLGSEPSAGEARASAPRVGGGRAELPPSMREPHRGLDAPPLRARPFGSTPPSEASTRRAGSVRAASRWTAAVALGAATLVGALAFDRLQGDGRDERTRVPPAGPASSEAAPAAAPAAAPRPPPSAPTPAPPAPAAGPQAVATRAPQRAPEPAPARETATAAPRVAPAAPARSPSDAPRAPDSAEAARPLAAARPQPEPTNAPAPTHTATPPASLRPSSSLAQTLRAAPAVAPKADAVPSSRPPRDPAGPSDPSASAPSEPSGASPDTNAPSSPGAGASAPATGPAEAAPAPAPTHDAPAPALPENPY